MKKHSVVVTVMLLLFVLGLALSPSQAIAGLPVQESASDEEDVNLATASVKADLTRATCAHFQNRV